MKICGRWDHNLGSYMRENNANNQSTVEKCKCDLVNWKINQNFHLEKWISYQKGQMEENLAEFDLCLESNWPWTDTSK